MDPSDLWAIGHVDLSAGRASSSDEPMGTKEKFWTRSADGQRWLFKYARDAGGSVRGEDWAEVLVHGLAELLGLPTVEVQLATCDGRRGVVSRSHVPDGWRLVHGNELLADSLAMYDAEQRRENPTYTVGAVQRSLRGVDPPLGAEHLDGVTGFDVWAGYLMLDAWVAGRDRHHENWRSSRTEDVDTSIPRSTTGTLSASKRATHDGASWPPIWSASMPGRGVVAVITSLAVRVWSRSQRRRSRWQVGLLCRTGEMRWPK